MCVQVRQHQQVCVGSGKKHLLLLLLLLLELRLFSLELFQLLSFCQLLRLFTLPDPAE